jgi:hypothetical protein
LGPGSIASPMSSAKPPPEEPARVRKSCEERCGSGNANVDHLHLHLRVSGWAQLCVNV